MKIRLKLKLRHYWVAWGVKVDACSAKCQWDGLNYSTLSIYNPPIVSEFLKLKKDDEIKIKGSVFNQLNIKTKRYFYLFESIVSKLYKKRLEKEQIQILKNRMKNDGIKKCKICSY